LKKDKKNSKSWIIYSPFPNHMIRQYCGLSLLVCWPCRYWQCWLSVAYLLCIPWNSWTRVLNTMRNHTITAFLRGWRESYQIFHWIDNGGPTLSNSSNWEDYRSPLTTREDNGWPKLDNNIKLSIEFLLTT